MRSTPTAALAIGALGVVFGDIGTSPLYALQATFTADRRAVTAAPADVFGVVSLVFWAITLIVSVKYVSFIMRADNGGEGGIMALTALVQGAKRAGARAKRTLVVLGILGAALFFGDAVVTPAISVVSAVDGLEVASPGLASYVVPISLAVLTALFALQRYGTGAVGRFFGPVMGLWFAVLVLMGLPEIARHPDVLRALSPTYALAFLLEHGWVGFLALGSVVLAVTGAEALYADMGHFGRSPIRRAWFIAVFPALTVNYLAQASLVVRAPRSVQNPFFLLVPGWAQIPLVVLATLATVIASQAVISGAFTVTRQADQLGFLPRMTVRHSSAVREGQVYAPAVNWTMFAAVAGLVVAFGSAAALASAYGVAVTGTFMLNTVMFLAVARLRWHIRRRVLAMAAAVFLSVELAFFLATLTKVFHGGWLPLAIGLALFGVMTTWHRGFKAVTERRNAKEGPIRDFLQHVAALQPPVQRVPGTAVFLNANPLTTPLALRENVEHNHVLHACVVTMSVKIAREPHVPEAERCAANHLGDSHDGVTGLTVRFGYQDRPDVPAAFRLALRQGLVERAIDPDHVSYFVSTLALARARRAHRRLGWGRRLYIAMARNAASVVAAFALPADRTVIVGAEIEI